METRTKINLDKEIMNLREIGIVVLLAFITASCGTKNKGTEIVNEEVTEKKTTEIQKYEFGFSQSDESEVQKIKDGEALIRIYTSLAHLKGLKDLSDMEKSITTPRITYLVDLKGDKVSGVYSDIERFQNGYSKVKRNDLMGLIDRSGNEVVKCQFVDVKIPSDGTVGFKTSLGWGVADLNGNIIVKPSYSELREFNEGFAVVKKGRTWSVINKNGETVYDSGISFYYTNSQGGVVNKNVIKDYNAVIKNSVEIEKMSWFSEGLCAVLQKHQNLKTFKKSYKVCFVNSKGQRKSKYFAANAGTKRISLPVICNGRFKYYGDWYDSDGELLESDDNYRTCSIHGENTKFVDLYKKYSITSKTIGGGAYLEDLGYNDAYGNPAVKQKRSPIRGYKVLVEGNEVFSVEGEDLQNTGSEALDVR